MPLTAQQQIDADNKLLKELERQTFDHFLNQLEIIIKSMREAFPIELSENINKAGGVYLAMNLGDIKNTQSEIKKDVDTQRTLDLIAAWRAFHAGRLATVRSLGLHKEEHHQWQSADAEIPHADPAIETPFIIGSMSYVCILFLVLKVYYKNEKTLSAREKTRMQFEIADAFVWTILNTLRLSGAGKFGINTSQAIGLSEYACGMLLLAGYLFDFVNQLIYDLRELYQLNKDIDNIKGMQSQGNPLQIKACEKLLKDAEAKRDQFIRRSVICNMLYAGGLNTGAVFNVLMAATPIGLIIIFLVTFINQTKNWYMALQEYKEIKQKCINQNNILNELEADKNPSIPNWNTKLINNGLKPIGENQTVAAYCAEQKHALSLEMRAATNKVALYSFWFAVILTSMACLVFCPALIVGLGVFLAGTGAYCIAKFVVPKITGGEYLSITSTGKTTTQMYKDYVMPTKPEDPNNNHNINKKLTLD